MVLAARLLAWLQSEWAEALVSPPDVYQRGPNAVRDGKTARRLIGILENHGWLTPAPDGGTVCGVRRREAWRIVKIA